MNLKLIIVVVLVVFFLFWYYNRNPLSAKIKIGTRQYLIELAVTPAEKAKGLSFRSSLPPNHGMLFLYDHKEQYSFWMNGMRFPLDFIWIDGNTIVDITENVPVPLVINIPIIKPSKQVDKILEVNAGTTARDGIKIGDSVKFLN